MINEIITPELRNLITTIDWKDPSYSVEKASVSSSFSALAYANIPDFELKKSSRIKLIPCEGYWDIIKSGQSRDIITSLRNLDFGTSFIINRQYAAIVGVKFFNVIFIAIRGTINLYDWLINLNVKKCVTQNSTNERFHLGFHRAISACLVPITEELKKYDSTGEIPIFVTGHSLGGAMAAIFHKKWHRYYGKTHNCCGLFFDSRALTTSCYTFGMPRYGNSAAVENRVPFHFYNQMDIVPTVPPKLFGYENSLYEFRLDGESIENISSGEGVNFLSWITHLLAGNAISHHSIELYKERIGRLMH